MRIVITHPEHGIFLGEAFGMGFWTRHDTAGQECACTFESEADARDFIAAWETGADDPDYGFAEIDTDQSFATIAELDAAGLENMTGPMKDAWLDNMEPAGFC